MAYSHQSERSGHCSVGYALAGHPPRPLPENFHENYQQWKNDEITGTTAAKACGMPLTTFRDRAAIYEKAKLS